MHTIIYKTHTGLPRISVHFKMLEGFISTYVLFIKQVFNRINTIQILNRKKITIGKIYKTVRKIKLKKYKRKEKGEEESNKQEASGLLNHNCKCVDCQP